MNLYQTIVVKGIGPLYEQVQTYKGVDVKQDGQIRDTEERKANLYRYFLNPNTETVPEIKGADAGQYFGSVIRSLITRINMLVYSDLTFEMADSENTAYKSLEEINENGFGVLNGTATKAINDKYFLAFFQKLNGLVPQEEIRLKEEEEELKKVKGDTDIINQLYYSFKNINDKWISGTAKGKLGYPFNPETNKLIDSFAFVDRGMNPIGETIINAEILADFLEDPNISLFSVLTQLLSLNGFEFFPLQNFLSFENEENWEDSFRINTGGYDDTQNASFVCMYIGGSSSYPSVAGNGFQNDGIIDITEPGVKGFSPTNNTSEFEENEKQENTDFKFREVRAFRVRFGEQNQSMFTDIKIDSKEYPETNESIQILSRLAGDQNPDAPVPKGQNLYNLYENRSYKATVTGLGNAMIQPTQYFQLENIPLFNGAYIILTVEHSITANKMMTSFSGTKLLKYPMPRVLTPVAFTSYDGLSGGDAVRAALSAAQLAKGMTPERVGNSAAEGGLDSELGIDISHWNGNLNWKEVKKSGVEFAIIKLTQGKTLYDGDTKRYPNYNLNGNINGAIDNDIKVSYYHFASFGRTADPVQDGIDDADHFIQRLGQVPNGGEPKLPVVLDLEEDCFLKSYKWGSIANPNTAINQFTEAFINRMESNGYDVMIYCRNDLLEKWQLQNYSKYPYWVARYYDLRGQFNPERDEPTAPSAWKNNWQAWQFTPAGSVAGTKGDVDLNVMKKDFIRQYT
jgi:GH25 family lysozyme M1 (1,4-beta-N-acetylmuramidase)